MMLVVALGPELNGINSILAARLPATDLDARSILWKPDEVNNSPLGPFFTQQLRMNLGHAIGTVRSDNGQFRNPEMLGWAFVDEA